MRQVSHSTANLASRAHSTIPQLAEQQRLSQIREQRAAPCGNRRHTGRTGHGGRTTPPLTRDHTHRPQAVAQSSQSPQPQNLQLMSVEQVLHTTSLQSSHWSISSHPRQ